MAPSLFNLDILSEVSALHIAHYAPATLFLSLYFYEQVFDGWMLIVILMFIAPLFILKLQGRADVRGGAINHFNKCEIVALTILAISPLAFLPIFKVMGGFAPRYVLTAVIGIFYLLTVAVETLTRPSKVAGITVLIILTIFTGKRFLLDGREGAFPYTREQLDSRMKTFAQYGTGPILYSEFLHFLPDLHYGEAKADIVYTYDIGKALQETHTDTPERCAQGLAFLL